MHANSFLKDMIISPKESIKYELFAAIVTICVIPAIGLYA